MTITWYGEDCFKLQSGDVSLITDPFGSETGLSGPRTKADIVLKTITPFPAEEKNEEGSFKIYSAGEYDLKGFGITGIGVTKESAPNFLKTIYLVRNEGLTLAFLGHLSSLPDTNIMEKLDIEDIDILFFPVGESKESPFLPAANTFGLIKDIEPKIAVPALYAVPGLKRKALDLKDFFAERHTKKEELFETGEKLTVKKKDLVEIKQTKFFVIKP